MSAGVEIEAQLRRLGRVRRQQRERDGTLMDEIREAVEAARDSGVSMTKVSELLGIDRTQLYRTYLKT